MVQHWCCRLWASEAPIKIQVISVTDSVWCFRRPSYFACSYLVSAEAGVFAVDVGMDSDAEDFLEGMESVGIPSERLRAILLTHWHIEGGFRVLATPGHTDGHVAYVCMSQRASCSVAMLWQW